MSIGALSVTGNISHREGAGMPLTNTVSMPLDNFMEGYDSTQYIDKMLEDNSSGVGLPAAFTLETVQGAGGITAARFEWLRKIAAICKRRQVVLRVADDQ